MDFSVLDQRFAVNVMSKLSEKMYLDKYSKTTYNSSTSSCYDHNDLYLFDQAI